MFRVYLLTALLALCVQSIAYAQLNLSVSLPRATYLLYEPVDIEVEVQNIGEKTISLKNDPDTKESWLQFVVQDAGESYIKPDVPIVVEDQTLRPNESVTVKANLMASYQMRTTGQYRAQAVVKVHGDASYVAPFIMVSIGAGETIWQQPRSEKKYSLIRFLLDNQTFLYLRIEDLKKGLIYCTRQLGSCNLSYKIADPLFDQDGNIHILHPRSPIEFRYTVMNPIGKLMKVEEYDGRWNFPTLLEAKSGDVKVNGTKIADNAKNNREKLSDVQSSKTPQKPAATY